MPKPLMTAEELIALFAAKAAAQLPESGQMLVRQLQCREFLEAARFLTEAMDRYGASDGHPLPVPTDLLSPLG